MSEDAPPINSAYGDPHAHTPTIQRLADEGVLFERGFCTSPVCAPSRFSVITGMYPESCGPAHQMRANADVPAEITTFAGLAKQSGYYCANNWKTDYNAAISPDEIWHESGPEAHWRSRPEGAPFIFFYNDFTTHESAVFTSPITTVQPDDVAVPAYLPDTPSVRADIARYYTAINEMDRNFGRLLGELEEDSLLDDTVVIHTSDHGSVVVRSKRFCYDTGLHIPFIVRVPPKFGHLSPWEAGTRVGQAVSQIDLAPTVLSLIGVEIPETMAGSPLFGERRLSPRGLAFSGRNRMDERYDFVRTLRDERYRYIRNYAPHRPLVQYQSFAWLARNYQTFEIEHDEGRLPEPGERYWYERPSEELYDTASDPEEIHNLIDEPSHQERLGRYRALLTEHMIETNDNGFIPEGCDVEGYHPSRMADAYPIRDIMALAETATERSPANLPTFVAALESDNEVIRWWGAQGLLMLRSDAMPAEAQLRDSAFNDESPQVRVASAEALSWLDVTAAMPVLLAHTEPVHDWRVRLQALNGLTYMPTVPPGVANELGRSVDDENLEVRIAARYLERLASGTHQPSEPVFDLERFLRSHPGLAHGGPGRDVEG
jgi:arylsulfatase A-like enzyme